MNSIKFLRKTGRRLYRDERGFTSAAGHLLLVLFLATCGIVGLSTFRNELVQQFGDVALALESLNQSYSITVGTVTSVYTDMPNTSSTNPVDVQNVWAETER